MLKSGRQKSFGLDHGSPLTSMQKHDIMKRAIQDNEKERSANQHIGPLTRMTLVVLEVLLFEFHNSKTGRCFPSYEAVAERAKCARSTVYKAIVALERAGILGWINRLARANVCGIRRVIRTSNAYTFQLPRRPLSSSEWQAPKFENRPGTKLQEYTTFRRPVWRPRNERVPPLNSASLSEDFSAEDLRARDSAAAQLLALGHPEYARRL